MRTPFTVLVQYVIPHHFLSRMVHRMVRSRHFPFRRSLVKWLSRIYEINTREALEPDFDNREVYPNLNSCFTRALCEGARPICLDPSLICSPADGTISQIGRIEGEDLFQAKGHRYSLTELLGGEDEDVSPFSDGNFITVYLSPSDYHRVHIPFDGRLKKMIHIPGRLFSVAPAPIEHIPRLFARNERVVCLFDTAIGPMAVILIGAIFVGSIETVWAGEVTPPRGKKITRTGYTQEKPIDLQKGEEMGRFNMGSTVIVLFGKDRIDWNPDLVSTDKVKMGEAIARIRT